MGHNMGCESCRLREREMIGISSPITWSIYAGRLASTPVRLHGTPHGNPRVRHSRQSLCAHLASSSSTMNTVVLRRWLGPLCVRRSCSSCSSLVDTQLCVPMAHKSPCS